MPCSGNFPTESLTPHEAEVLRRAVLEINAGLFFEAHETLEIAWAPCRTRNRLFLQAIIHAAVGSYHALRGNTLGMDRQFAKAIRKLRSYLPEHEGLDTTNLLRVLEELRSQISADSRPPTIPQPLVYWKCDSDGASPRQTATRSC